MKINAEKTLTKAAEIAASVLFLATVGVVTHYAVMGVDALFHRVFSRK